MDKLLCFIYAQTVLILMPERNVMNATMWCAILFGNNSLAHCDDSAMVLLF